MHSKASVHLIRLNVKRDHGKANAYNDNIYTQNSGPSVLIFYLIDRNMHRSERRKIRLHTPKHKKNNSSKAAILQTLS